MLDILNKLDRRWLFLAMVVAVALPILLGIGSVETPSEPTRRMFDLVESLPAGSRVLLSIDFDPNTAAELEPMSLSFTRHCCLKRHKLYLVTLWGTALPMVDGTIKSVIEGEFGVGGLPMKYGEDFLNLGYLAGENVAVSQLATDIRKARSQDVHGMSLDKLPMMRGVTSAQDMQLIINVSGGYPGAKEWVQYACTPFKIPLVAGSTGVQATQLFPYYPNQVRGMVTAIRGANEYETLLAQKYPAEAGQIAKRPASRRGGPQQWAHRLMIGLIVLGNGIHLANRARKGTP